METVLNYPIRKFFTCELQHVRYDSFSGKWALKFKGRQVPMILVWLQGYLKQPSNYPSNRYAFTDATGRVDLCVTPGTTTATSDGEYCRLFAEIEDVITTCDRTVTLKAKTLTPLEGDRQNLEDMWYAEILDYHKFLQHSVVL